MGLFVGRMLLQKFSDSSEGSPHFITSYEGKIKTNHTTPYEWKILEWDDKPQTNKQTNFIKEGTKYLGHCSLHTGVHWIFAIAYLLSLCVTCHYLSVLFKTSTSSDLDISTRTSWGRKYFWLNDKLIMYMIIFKFENHLGRPQRSPE